MLYRPKWWKTDPKTGRRVRGVSKNWWCRFTFNRRLVRKNLRTSDRFVAQQMETAIVRAMGLRAAGMETFGETTIVPVKTLITEYVAEMRRRGRNPRYVRQTEAVLTRSIGSTKTLNEVTVEHVRVIIGRVADAASPTTANHYRAALSGFFHWLVKEGRWGANPVARVNPAESDDPRRKRRALTIAERDRLLAKSPALRSAAYRVALTTGLRRSEVRRLLRSDVDLDAATLTIRGRANWKNRSVRVLPLPPGTVSTLKRLRGHVDPTESLFPSVPNMDTFRRDLAAAGIEYETTEGVADFHALRVTFNTLMAREGVSLAQRQSLMRHATPKLTAGVYTRLDLADGAAAVAKIDAPEPDSL